MTRRAPQAPGFSHGEDVKNPTVRYERASHAESVMGTVASFAIHVDSIGNSEITSAIECACKSLHLADEMFSTWKPNSALSRLRRGEISLLEAPVEILEVIELCKLAREVSQGWFDPWRMPGGFDPTGLVKGWAVERALGKLRKPGICGAMINAGGDLVTFGKPVPGQSWRIGIRDPWNREAIRCVIETTAAVATSGTYERGEILLDPHSGERACQLASATVIGPSLAMADALATALAVAGDPGMKWLAALDGYEAYVIRLDGSEVVTSGLLG